jgi:hypothetical protein
MRLLAEIYEKYKGDKGWSDKGTIHSYIEVYEHLLAPYRSVSGANVLEIGLMSGHSMRMFEEYFEIGTVYGIDITDQPVGGQADLRPMIAEGYHRIHLFDAANGAEAEIHFGGTKFSVVIEDANHDIEQQVAIYKNFKSRMTSDGIYIMEDIQFLDRDRGILESIDPERRVRIIDRRNIKGRYDDVLVVID